MRHSSPGYPTGVIDKGGRMIRCGDRVRYYDSFQTWLNGSIIWVGGGWAVKTGDPHAGNAIPLLEFFKHWAHDAGEHVESPNQAKEIEIAGEPK